MGWLARGPYTEPDTPYEPEAPEAPGTPELPVQQTWVVYHVENTGAKRALKELVRVQACGEDDALVNGAEKSSEVREKAAKGFRFVALPDGVGRVLDVKWHVSVPAEEPEE